MSDIIKLMDAIKADFPARKQEAELYMATIGPYDPLTMILEPPEKHSRIATFDASASHTPSPMLKQRFQYAATWNTGWHSWLGPSDMAKMMDDQSVRTHHEALRNHYENSAPMLYPYKQLSLFVVTEAVPDELIYLVWKSIAEPEVLSYGGYDFYRFDNVQDYFSWYLLRP